jgi:hypothetical protein
VLVGDLCGGSNVSWRNIVASLIAVSEIDNSPGCRPRISRRLCSSRVGVMRTLERLHVLGVLAGLGVAVRALNCSTSA